MTEQQAIAAANAARYTREDIARRIASRIIHEPSTSIRHGNYLRLIAEMKTRAYNNKVTKWDMRFIAKNNAGDKLAASRKLYYYLEAHNDNLVK